MLFAIELAWGAVAIVWLLTALKLKVVSQSESFDSQIGHQVTMAIALTLLFSPDLGIGWLSWPVVSETRVTNTLGVLLTYAGAAFAIWARVNLGRNWSARVTLKHGHTLQRNGPYAIVRHPIYAGLFAAMLGSAIVFGQLRCFLGAVVAFAAWLAKARLEEAFLMTRFGETYADYRREVKTLIPFVL
jgi:protein-S-isoprenylcysteine O-methyltransferase Ste14